MGMNTDDLLHLNDDFGLPMGKRCTDTVELTTLKALAGKARSLGFSEDEIGKLRYGYRHGLESVCK
ncbi:MAG: hypothetical protein L3J32_03620 [Rhizobiaceae bacterium]|nr:hypothetical protein [Rhizobiaceae bacterium]